MAKKKKKVAEKKEPAPDETDQKRLPRAVLFELENVAIKGRQIIYDVLESVLADKSVKLTQLMFSRYCLGSSPKDFLSVLLKSAGKKRLSEKKLCAEITQGIRLSFTDGTLKLESGFKKVLKAAAERNVLVGMLSGFDMETAGQLAAKLGLADIKENLLSYSCEDKNSPTVDAWLKLAKKLSVFPSLCVALTTSAMSCRAALSAGMRCIVIPDKFTDYQDFGGADYIVDALNDTAIENIFTLLES